MDTDIPANLRDTSLFTDGLFFSSKPVEHA